MKSRNLVASVWYRPHSLWGPWRYKEVEVGLPHVMSLTWWTTYSSLIPFLKRLSASCWFLDDVDVTCYHFSPSLLRSLSLPQIVRYSLNKSSCSEQREKCNCASWVSNQLPCFILSWVPVLWPFSHQLSPSAAQIEDSPAWSDLSM